MGWADGAIELDGEKIGNRSSVSKAEEKKAEKGEYLSHQLRHGVAVGAGMVADFPFNVANLLNAGISLPVGEGLSAITGKSPADYAISPIPNYGTNALKRYLGVDVPVGPAPDLGTRLAGGALAGVGSTLGGGFANPAALASGALAGAGSEGAGAVTNNNPLAMFAGGLAGGVVLPSLVQSRANVLSNLANSTTQNLRQNAGPMVSGMVNKQLQQSVAGTPNAAESIEQALALRQRIPGFNPSVAEMSGSPGAADMQRRFALTSPEALNKEVARQAANKEAINTYLEQQAPSQGQIGSVRGAVNQDLANRTAGLDRQAEQIAAKVPVQDQAAIGNRMGEVATELKQAARPPIQEAYDTAFKAAGQSKIDIAPVIAKVEEILGTKLSAIKPETAPGSVQKLRAAIEEGEGVTLQQLDEIKKALNADVAAGSRSLDPVAATRLRNLSQVSKTVDEALAASSVSKEAKDAYAAAVAKYRNEFAPRFNEGTNLRMFRETSLNEPQIKADRFTEAYFKPDRQGGATQADSFKRLFGGNAEAADLTKKGILDLYRAKVVNPQNGQINPALHNRFLADYGQTLDRFKAGGVNALDDIRSIGKEAAKIAESQVKLQDLSGKLRFDTTDDLIKAAIASPKVMGNVQMSMNQTTRETFQRAVMDKALESGNALGMKQFLTENQKTLKMLLTPKHLGALDDVANALQIIERSHIRGTVQAGGPDVLKNATGVSMATVWAQYRAVSGGRQGPATAVFNRAPSQRNCRRRSFPPSWKMRSTTQGQRKTCATSCYLELRSRQRPSGKGFFREQKTLEMWSGIFVGHYPATHSEPLIIKRILPPALMGTAPQFQQAQQQ